MGCGGGGRGGDYACNFQKHRFEITVDSKGPLGGPTFWFCFRGAREVAIPIFSP